MNDAILTTCPECGKETFAKQLSAPGFQLKGSGWYATDFKGGNSKPKEQSASSAAEPVAASEPAAASCGSGCACH
jgi:predicted nucleic acid-binding Zn ribbon protein